MTCVLGMVVRREREIREFRQDTVLPGAQHRLMQQGHTFEGEWRAVKGSPLF